MPKTRRDDYPAQGEVKGCPLLDDSVFHEIDMHHQASILPAEVI